MPGQLPLTCDVENQEEGVIEEPVLRGKRFASVVVLYRMLTT